MTLAQTGKGALVPIVFVDRPGGSYWTEWEDYVEKHLSDGGYIDEADRSLYLVTESVDEAVDEVVRFYSNYHSSRFVHPKLVLRFQRPISDETLERINDEYGSIVVDGKIERLARHEPAEDNEPHTHSLHRLAFRYDRRSFGRLRRMINSLNVADAAQDETQDGTD